MVNIKTTPLTNLNLEGVSDSIQIFVAGHTDYLSASLAKDWAIKENSPVDGINFSSKYYANQAKNSENSARLYMQNMAAAVEHGIMPASESRLGGIIVGDNLDITESGVLSGKLTAQWGNIQGDISDQTDLSSEFQELEDKSAFLSMPSNISVNITVGGADTTYTAPDAGYFTCWGFINTESNGYVQIKNISCNVGSSMFVPQGWGSGMLTVPAKKGDIVAIYGFNSTTNANVQFNYAEGTKNNA